MIEDIAFISTIENAIRVFRSGPKDLAAAIRYVASSNDSVIPSDPLDVIVCAPPQPVHA